MRTIIEDSRQKAGKHEHKAAAFAAAGVRIKRSKLPYGDYALMPLVSVDTKEDIYELANNINTEHQRFKRELIGARDDGCRLIILTENTDNVATLEDLCGWVEDFDHYCMRLATNPRAVRISGATLAKACSIMASRYGAEFRFCRPEEAADIIQAILGGASDG